MLAFGTSTATTAPATLGGTSARAYLGDYLKPAIYLYFRRDYPPPLVASGGSLA